MARETDEETPRTTSTAEPERGGTIPAGQYLASPDGVVVAPERADTDVRGPSSNVPSDGVPTTELPSTEFPSTERPESSATGHVAKTHAASPEGDTFDVQPRSPVSDESSESREEEIAEMKRALLGRSLAHTMVSEGAVSNAPPRAASADELDAGGADSERAGGTRSGAAPNSSAVAISAAAASDAAPGTRAAARDDVARRSPVRSTGWIVAVILVGLALVASASLRERDGNQQRAGGADDTPAAANSTVSVTFVDAPPDTAVWHGSRLLGAASNPLRIARSSQLVELRLIADGFQTKNVSFVPREDQVIQIRMSRQVGAVESGAPRERAAPPSSGGASKTPATRAASPFRPALSRRCFRI